MLLDETVMQAGTVNEVGLRNVKVRRWGFEPHPWDVLDKSLVNPSSADV